MSNSLGSEVELPPTTNLPVIGLTFKG